MKFLNANVEEREIYTGFHPYHHHDTGYYKNLPLKNDKPYMIGVELETFFPGEDEREEWCEECKSNWFYMERDGSLPEGGCEFITTPLAPKDAKNPATWLPLIKALREAGVRSFVSSTTGAHVHVSKRIFGETSQEQSDGIGRLIYLYYYVLSESVRSRVFGRRSTHYATDLDKSSAYKTRAADILKVALKYKEVRDEINKELVGVCRGNRYHSINVQNTNTVEFRQGKGSINNRRLAAICEFAEACCLYAKRHTDISLYTEAGMLAMLKEDGICKTYYLSEEL